MKKYSFLFLAAGLFLSACSNNDDDTNIIEPSTPSALELEFDSRFGTEDFTLNKLYVNKNGDSVVVSSLLYFISNVEFVKADGSVHKIPDSYYLIQNTEQKVREKVALPEIPAGEYTKLRFTIGVDSAHNQSTVNAVGDLTTPNSHMTWDWNTGYIFLNLNGQYYDPADTKYNGLVYEIGKDHSRRTVELAFPAATPKVQIGGGHNPKFHIHADVKAIFGGPNTLDVKAEPRIDGTPDQSANSVKVADNYATMFRIDHIHAH